MADLTFYFPSTGTAAHSPAISATWLHEEGATRLPLVTSPSSSARANRKASVWAAGTQTNCAQQYVSAAQSAHEWTTDDSLEMQVSCIREANCSAAYMYLIVRVFNADCSTARGILYSGAAPTNLSNSQFANRALAAGGGHVHVQNAVSMSAGDHIVVEIGFTSTVSSAWAGATYKVGDNEASDLPVDETTDTWDSYNPWISFTFYAATAPTVTTTTPTYTSGTTASGGGNVTADGGASVTDRGVCWSTSANPTTSDSHTHNSSGTGEFTSTLTSLAARTHYHVRAYAINSVGTSYGADVEFDTYGTITVCDMYFDWHTGSDGNAVTTAIATGGCRPTSPTYAPSVYPQSPLTNLLVETDSASPIVGYVRCGGVAYDFDDTTQGLIYDHSTDTHDVVHVDVLAGSFASASMGFMFKTTLDDAWEYHALAGICGGTGGGLSDWAILSKYSPASGTYLKLETSGHYWPSDSSGIAISTNTWYWVTIKYDSATEKAYLAVYLASTMAQVGSTVEADLTDPTNVSFFTIGQNASQGNTDSAYSWFGPVIMDWADATFPLKATPPTAYTISCEGGSYAMTGTAVGTLKGSKLAAEGGEYALTGQAAGAYYGRKLAAEAGEYALTGATAGLLRAAKLGAEAGEYALTGTAAATLYGRKLAAEAGEYTLTGQDIAALYGRLIAAEAGEYTLTGADATLLRTALLTAEAGEYALTGADIAALYGRLLVAEAGEYAITGSDVALLRAALLTAEAGEYAWTGSDVTLLASAAGAYVLVAESGTYALTGAPVALLKTSKLTAEGGSYAVTGQDAATLVGRLLDAGAGAYALTGADAALLRDAVLAAEAGAYTLTGADVTLLVATINNYIITAESGSYALTGTAANLLKGSYGPALKWAVGSSRLARSVGSSRLTKTRRSGLAGTNIREN